MNTQASNRKKSSKANVNENAAILAAAVSETIETPIEVFETLPVHVPKEPTNEPETNTDTVKTQLNAYLQEPTDENKKLLLHAIKVTGIRPGYFSGISAGRHVTVKLEKNGRLTAYYFDFDGKPVIESGVPLIKTRELDKYLGLSLKHNLVFYSALVSDVFKLGTCQPMDRIAFESCESKVTETSVCHKDVIAAIQTVPVTLGFVTVIIDRGNGQTTSTQKAILGTETTDETKALVSRYVTVNRLKERVVRSAAKDFLSESRKGLRQINKK